MDNQVGLVFDDPMDDFAFLKLHCFGYSGGEVNVVLIGSLLPANELNFGGITHADFLVV
jgi:hypothetical protein